MKKILSFLTMLILLMCCVSCNTNESDEITLMVGEYIHSDLDLKTIKKINLKDQEIGGVSNSGVFYGSKEGETTAEIIFKNGKKRTITINVIPRKIKDINVSENQKIENEVQRKTTEYERKIKASNYLKINVLEGEKMLDFYTLNMKANPLTFEYVDGREVRVLKKENSKFYEYRKIDDNYFQKSEYANDSEDFQKLYESSLYYFDSNKMLDFIFDNSNGNAYFNGEYYILRGYYKDLINEQMREEIEQKNNSAYLDEIMESIASIYFKFNRNKAIAGVSALFEMDGFEFKYNISIHMDLSKFEAIKLNGDNTLSKKPTTIDEVSKETKVIGVPYTFFSDSIIVECIKTKLEQGQYVLKDKSGENEDYISITVYDENKNIIPQSGVRNGTFYIPKDGIYYLSLSKERTGMMTVIFEKTSTDPSLDPSKTIEIKSGDYVFKDEIDVKSFGYNNETGKDQILEITNNSDTTIIVSHKFYDFPDENNILTETVIDSGATKHFYLEQGNNRLTIYVRDLREEKTINLDMKIFDYNFKGGTDWDDYDNMKDVIIGETYVVGVRYYDAWFYLKVEESGSYKMDAEGKANISVIQKDYLHVDSDKNVFELEKGEYYIKFSSIHREYSEFKFSMEQISK